MSPEVAASVVDAAVRGLLTSSALRRPEVARRLAIGANAVASQLTLVDDPTTPGAYGGYRFDDEGEPAAPVKLVENGRVIGRLADHGAIAAKIATTAGRGQRPGHVGPVEPSPSHVRLAHGTFDQDALLDDGFMLEGAQGAIVDPSSDRAVIAVARARERKGGRRTGRVFADIELVGELSKVLASVSALSLQTRSIGLRDEVGGQPRWRSIETPWLRGRGLLRARRRPT
jgi:TldD protein